MVASKFFIVSAWLPPEISFGATGLRALTQQIRTILTTRKGSVPLDRDFGIAWTIVDQPLNAVLPIYIGEVAAQVEKYVPQVRVSSVRFEPENMKQSANETVQGILKPVVRCRLREEYIDEYI